MFYYLKKIIPRTLINIYHLLIVLFAAFLFGFPSKRLITIGVTGTNGKTTTVNLITKILEHAGYKVAMMSTINFKIRDKEWVNETKMTTPGSFYLQKFLKRAVRAGCRYVVLEISSHSLDQNRVAGIQYHTAVFTNLTREHLDYHKTMEQYRDAKGALFQRAKVHVVNLDDEYAEYFLNFSAEEKYGYGVHVERYEKFLNRTDFKTITAQNIISSDQGVNFQVLQHLVHIRLFGEVNVYNALAAIGVGLSQNIPLLKMIEAFGEVLLIPGRFEFVESGQRFKVLIDYALTPDSLEKLYQALQDSKFLSLGSKLIWVFGSCGERDQGKRPIMGEVVGSRADYVIVTNEDPYREDPQKIIDQIFEGVLRSGKREQENAWRIFDRREAIRKALSLAKDNDVVLVTGKGAETRMAIGDKRIPWSERQVILEELNRLQ